MKKKGKEVKEEIEKQQGQGEGKMNGPDIDRHERVRPGVSETSLSELSSVVFRESKRNFPRYSYRRNRGNEGRR